MRRISVAVLLAIAAPSVVLLQACGPNSSTDPNGDAGVVGGPGTVQDGGPNAETFTVEILSEFGDAVVGGQTPLRALVRDESGRVAGGKTLSWSSDAPAVATVDATTGIVTGVSAGTATISVSTEGAEASVEVQVEPGVAEPGIMPTSTFDCALSRAGKLYCRDPLGYYIREPHPTAPNYSWEHVAPALRFKAIAGVGNPVFVIGVDGQLYSFGQGGAMLGQGFTDQRSIRVPTPLATSVRFKAVAARDRRAVAIAEDGTLYQWGDQHGGVAEMAAPTQMPGGGTFTSVQLSQSHGLALGTDGELYSWRSGGSLDESYLGVPKNGGAHPKDIPTAIATPVPFKAFAAGDFMSFGLSADGVAYSWGPRHPSHGSTDTRGVAAFGRGESAMPSATPLPVTTNERFKTILAGSNYVVALRADGIPFYWGQHLTIDALQFQDSWVPIQASSQPLTSLFMTRVMNSVLHYWAGHGTNGQVIRFGDAGHGFEQSPEYLPVSTQLQITLPRGGSEEVTLQPFAKAASMTANGVALPAGEVRPKLQIAQSQPSETGKVDYAGLSLELQPSSVPPGHAAAGLSIRASEAAIVGDKTIYVGGSSALVSVVPPAPPAGTALDLRCSVPESIVYGYWCLTNSGGATAPHKWVDLPLAGSTWRYENVCISYGSGGRGTARFLNPNGSVGTKSIRYGVLSRSSGVPEVTSSGHWLLYHEGIGDPQVEQLTFKPETGAVGEAWPFVEAACSF